MNKDQTKVTLKNQANEKGIDLTEQYDHSFISIGLDDSIQQSTISETREN